MFICALLTEQELLLFPKQDTDYKSAPAMNLCDALFRSEKPYLPLVTNEGQEEPNKRTMCLYV
ncbi:hypothetical protein D0T49_09495 [Paludibacter sp. 221]|nr:hypothetical protein [Paludibacter sp. 221]